MKLCGKKLNFCALFFSAYLFFPLSELCFGSQGSRIAKSTLRDLPEGDNLLKKDAWRPYKQGFTREGELFVCDNGKDFKAQRGAFQTVFLNQSEPIPIIATCLSKAEGVSAGPDNNYSLYLDILYQDGTPLWGQAAPFPTGTGGWTKRRVLVFPEKPIRSVSFYLLLRGHSGKALFKEPKLWQLSSPSKACLFDGVAVRINRKAEGGFQIRDVASQSDFMRIENEELGFVLKKKKKERKNAVFWDLELFEGTGRDRAITLYYTIPLGPASFKKGDHSGSSEKKTERLFWLHDPYTQIPVKPAHEYMNAARFRVGANGRLSRYPLGAVSNGKEGIALAIDMTYPAFFRIGYNADSSELFLAYDLGFAPEKRRCRLRFCSFSFKAEWGFRSALTRYYELFPEAFRCRIKEQGLWMPFARISRVKGWEDFGFKFKEGTNEIAWDDAHDILTFRYTEPATWWMPMPAKASRTLQKALELAKLLAKRGDRRAISLFTSGFHDEKGRFLCRLLNTPWCNGAVWSMNSMPGIQGKYTDFNLKWNSEIKRRYYGPEKTADLDGEYIDSSEAYVTAELDFRRDHFSACETPLTFSLDSRKPGIFKCLAVFEYIRAIARDVHRMGKYTMANGTPSRICFYVPYLDVLGTETNWNPGGRWRPMSVRDLIYRRALCKGKPFCFLMNTRFEDFPPGLVEKYMKRALAFGMFPGFFSPNASQGHYFTRPELYNRDRPLFKKYVPLCKLVAEAGWQPIPLARVDKEGITVERFGNRYLTVFNSTKKRLKATLKLQFDPPPECLDLVRGRKIRWEGRKSVLTLEPEDVALIDVFAFSRKNKKDP